VPHLPPILWTILIGFAAGVLAKWILPGKDPGGLILTTLLGIGGAVVADYVGAWLGWSHHGALSGFVADVVGAILILLAFRLIIKL